MSEIVVDEFVFRGLRVIECPALGDCVATVDMEVLEEAFHRDVLSLAAPERLLGSPGSLAEAKVIGTETRKKLCRLFSRHG